MQEIKETYKAGSDSWKPPNEKEGEQSYSFLMLIFGPVIGLLYVIFMPILAIATVTALIGSKFLGFLFGLAGKSISFGWRPEASYLSGKEKDKEKNNDSK
jgi:hypothetical protein